MFKKFFLPLGLVAAIILSAVAPELGSRIKELCGSSFFIIVIFLVSGWQLEVTDMRFDRRFLAAFLLCGAVTLVASPWFGVAVARGLQLDDLAMTGLVVMASVPPTLSSGIVMTETAAGNVMLGVMMTVFYNLAGVFTLPVMLNMCLASDGDIDTKPLRMFLQLLLLVIIPFAAGFGAKRICKRKLPSWTGYIPSTCVILLTLSFFSSANQQFRAYPAAALLLMGASGLVMRLVLMAILWYGGSLLGMPSGDRKAAIFTAGSKTLTIALATLAIMDVGDTAAVIPCMMFYFLQSVFDSLLAGWLGSRSISRKI